MSERSLEARIYDSKQVVTTVDGMKFTAQRPTLEDLVHARIDDKIQHPVFLRKYVNGWEGVRESDVLEGGSDALLPFNKGLFDLVVGDMPKIWKPVAEKLIKAANDFHAAQEKNSKNSKSGLKVSNSKT